MKIPKTWTFKDSNVADGFEAHVREQLPWYGMATDAVTHIVRHYLPQGGVMYDIGASTGNIGRSVAQILKDRRASLFAIEESNEMAKKYNGPGTLIQDSAQKIAFERFDVATLFLVMMFIPVTERADLIGKLKKQLKPGGVIIIFDKIIAPSGYFGTVLRRLTMDWKLKNGASPKDIIAKELSLSGVQRPISPTILGADAVCFFTFGEFAGYVIEGKE
jgi:tRNA (cmo5U34)-methyltransferase